jgi:hypothetical protein
MGKTRGEWVAWLKRHAFALGTLLVTTIVGLVTTALFPSAQSYAKAAWLVIAANWHGYSVAGGFLVGLPFGSALTRLWDRLRKPSTMPDESQGVRWRCVWDGLRIVSLTPICPSPNCGSDLETTQTGGLNGTDTILLCKAADCGFRWRLQEIPAVVLANARRDLEGQARGLAAAPRPRGKFRSS